MDSFRELFNFLFYHDFDRRLWVALYPWQFEVLIGTVSICFSFKACPRVLEISVNLICQLGYLFEKVVNIAVERLHQIFALLEI